MTVLCYHTIDPAWSGGLAMTPANFAGHARWLSRHRQVVDLATATRQMDRSGRAPRGVAALTFDDGLSGVHEYALPVLRDLGLPATVFVVAGTLTGDPVVDWVDDPPEHPLSVVTLDQLEEMVEGGFEVASHSLRHHTLPDLDHGDCVRDLRESREILEDLLRRPVRTLAYPRGRHDEMVRDAARRAGYDHAYSLPEGREPVGPFSLPRVGVYRHNGLSTLRVKATRPYLPVRTHPGWGTVRRGLPRRPAPVSATGPAPAPAAELPAIVERATSAVRPRRTVAYVMSRFPKVTETFVLNEILAVERLGVDVRVQPLLRERVDRLQPGAAELVERAHYLPFLSPAIVASQLWFLRHRPARYLRTLGEVLTGTAGSLNFTVGALGILPKVVHAARELEAAGVDHVHCHFASHPAVAGFVISRLTGIPFSFTAHGSDLHVDRHMLPQKVDAAAAVVAISADNRDLIVAECGDRFADKVHVVHCGVDTERFAPIDRRDRTGTVRLLCIGTLHEVKGQHVLLDALAAVTRAGADVELRLVGDGPWASRLRARARDLRLGDHARFVGALDQTGVLSELRDADVLVAPSVPTANGKREGIPVVLMEAMATGLPVIASDLSGIPELVEDGVSGLLVGPGDVDGLASAIARLAAEPELRAQLGSAGRRRVARDFDLHVNAVRLVEQVLDGQPIARTVTDRAAVRITRTP